MSTYFSDVPLKKTILERRKPKHRVAPPIYTPSCPFLVALSCGAFTSASEDDGASPCLRQEVVVDVVGVALDIIVVSAFLAVYDLVGG